MTLIEMAGRAFVVAGLWVSAWLPLITLGLTLWWFVHRFVAAPLAQLLAVVGS